MSQAISIIAAFSSLSYVIPHLQLITLVLNFKLIEDGASIFDIEYLYENVIELAKNIESDEDENAFYEFSRDRTPEDHLRDAEMNESEGLDPGGERAQAWSGHYDLGT